ncbi:MAG: FAD-dependent thymidylate synthase [candidate division WOR-3 bacterium]
MKVFLAGYNVDTEILKELNKEHNGIPLTPETISAAYARISRSPNSVIELRREARTEVENARKSNRRIIFEMSHHSIAEHAVFNFDIIGISRRAVEELEGHRLCSYTEKSQRYVTFKGGVFIPEELKNPSLLGQYLNLIKLQQSFYLNLLDKLISLNQKKFPDLINEPKGKRQLENLAKEDARYILPLATKTQLGATINARNLELMLRRFASHQLKEINQLGEKLFHTTRRIAPSLLLFFKANDYDRLTYPMLREYINGAFSRKNQDTLKIKCRSDVLSDEGVSLVDYTSDGDDKVLAAILFKIKNIDYQRCQSIIKKMNEKQKLELFKKACHYLELYDTVLREFEFTNLTYSLTVSAAAFGQLKRHRIATIIAQEYNPQLGNTIPESIKEIGEEKNFMEIVERTNSLYNKIEKKYPGVGSYILTNSHRKRVLMSLNLRELYHISRLREDPTAQWDIRDTVHKMSKLAKRILPVTSRLLCSKSDYPEVYYKIYGKYPKVTAVPPPG